MNDMTTFIASRIMEEADKSVEAEIPCIFCKNAIIQEMER